MKALIKHNIDTEHMLFFTERVLALNLVTLYIMCP